MTDKIYKLLMKEVSIAYKKDEIPIGCVITKNNKIISHSHNTKNKKNKCINHAEILAILKAEKKLKNWRLNDCILYVTLKPCKMCYEAIKQSRIGKIEYLLDSKYINDDNRLLQMEEVVNYQKEKEDYLKLIKHFFRNKR